MFVVWAQALGLSCGAFSFIERKDDEEALTTDATPCSQLTGLIPQGLQGWAATEIQGPRDKAFFLATSAIRIISV